MTVSQCTLMTHTRYLKAISLSCCHTKIYFVWAQTPAVTLWHLLFLLIQSTFIKCFALLASTVITIMQMVQIGRESSAKAAPAHSTQGSPPGWDQSSPSCSYLYSWGTISPNVKLSTKASGYLISQYNTGWAQAEERNLIINDDEYNQIKCDTQMWVLLWRRPTSKSYCLTVCKTWCIWVSAVHAECVCVWHRMNKSWVGQT